MDETAHFHDLGGDDSKDQSNNDFDTEYKSLAQDFSEDKKVDEDLRNESNLEGLNWNY